MENTETLSSSTTYLSNGTNAKPSTVIDVNMNNSQSNAQSFTVVKRSGALVPFRKDRVAAAVEAAFRATNGIAITSPLPQEIYTAVQAVTEDVAREAAKKALEGACLTVEGVQDIVEMKLMQGGHYEVGRNYIVYRDERKVLREDSPRNIKVLRRDGKTHVRFNPMKIASAIEKAFRASYAIEGTTPDEYLAKITILTNKLIVRCVEISKSGAELQIEQIQDEIEKAMMVEGYYQVAKDFILYRAARAKVRIEKEITPEIEVAHEEPKLTVKNPGTIFHAVAKDGKNVEVSERELRERINYACRDNENITSATEIYEESVRSFYEGMRIDEIDTANILAARTKIEKEPAYAYVTAALLLDVIYRETMGVEANSKKITETHAAYFKNYIQQAISYERVSPELATYDLERLGKALNIERDRQFEYLGLQTLYDRYLIHHEEHRLETPQIFWMRVAMGLALREGDKKNEKAIEFYDVLSKFLFTSSTPTLFNSGTMHSQMSSCYLTTVMDDLKHIFKCVADDAHLSKWAGGLGNDWTNVRATGARIKGTNGKSQGVIPFLKVANDTAVAVNQGGKRKGAMCAYLESWHLDVEDFLELRKNTGDERRRTHDMNTANWIPDLFMKRVKENGTWTLFTPSEVPDLHDLYGKAFEKRYCEYEKLAEEGKIKLSKKLQSVDLWRKMLSMLFETGHPWITFKDPSNIRSPQDHCGVVHSSNLCTEILLNTSDAETAVCNLGSINLPRHTTKDGINRELLAKTVKTAIRMLDNVIDINFYPTIEAEVSNKKHRPIGLGIMGFQDALYALDISYASQEAVKFADESMELISYNAILGSSELAKERGAYESYKGSKWDRGMLPIDTLDLLSQERGAEYCDLDKSTSLDWKTVRESVKKYGMRNSNTMAIAPTATISNITGVTQSIEPTYKHLYAKSNLSGEFTVHNEYLVKKLKTLGMWDQEMLDDLKYFDGSITEIERIPDEVKQIFLTAFEVEPDWIIECAARRQKWIDMGESLNLYMAQPSGKKLNDMYQLAWKKGLKTTYYLRSLGATQIEKSTMDVNKRGLQPRWMKNKSASSNINVDRAAEGDLPLPKVCGLDGDCESCQ